MKWKVKMVGVAVAMVMMSGMMMGCDRRMESAAYDPQLDGVLPTDRAAPDVTILENQRTAYDKLREAAPAPAARPATTGPAAGAATTPA